MTEHEILNNLIEYVVELKSCDDIEENIYFWKEVIGMSKQQMEKYGII